jgi:hypothetical protein
VRDRHKVTRRRGQEGGFSLFLALLAVVSISGYVLLNLNVDRDRVERERATQSAWLLENIASAARLYVRDNAAAGIFSRAALCALPQTIAPATLIAGGYISANIGQRDAAGDYVTPLGQTVRIVAANSRITQPACDDATLQNAAATSSAYLILQAGPRTTQNGILLQAEALQVQSIPVNAPYYDAGVNRSPDCQGAGPGTIQWDTGCLTDTQYAFINGGGAFTPDSFGVPVWLTFRGDNRAIFRFPQPENPTAQQMASDLRMAPVVDVNGDGNRDDADVAACNQTQIRMGDTQPGTATAPVDSGVCALEDDVAIGIVNNRRNIFNVARIDSERTIIEPQTVDVQTAGVVAELNDPLTVTSINPADETIINGNARSFALGANPGIAMTNLTLQNDLSGVSALQKTGGAAPRIAVAGNLAAGSIQASTASMAATSISGTTTATGQFSSTNGATSVSGGNVVVEQLSGSPGSIAVDGELNVAGTTAVNGTTTIGNADGVLAVAAASLQVGSLSMPTGGTLNVGNDLRTNNADIDTISSIGTCYGDCPQRGGGSDPDPPL